MEIQAGKQFFARETPETPLSSLDDELHQIGWVMRAGVHLKCDARWMLYLALAAASLRHFQKKCSVRKRKPPSQKPREGLDFSNAHRVKSAA
jgi:hypothetical protein